MENFVYYLYKSPLLSPAINFLRRLSLIQIAIFLTVIMFILALLILLIIYFLRLILTLLGKNHISNYKKYSKQVFSEIRDEKSFNDIIYYKKLTLPRDKWMNFVKFILFTLLVFIYITLLMYIGGAIELNISNPFLEATITTLGTIFLTLIIVIVWHMIKMFISGRKKQPDKPHVRIRRVVKGGKKND